MFKIIKQSKISGARLGIIETSIGRIKTPFFMPDATFGQVKNLSASELNNLGVECVVANTLHLFLRPGLKLIKQAGGLNVFTGWSGNILSDSGGYQVYSLIHRSRSGQSGKITDQGAIFNSPLDGSKINLTPEQSIKIQFALGARMMVCLDDCPPNDYDGEKTALAVERTIKWARRCAKEFNKQIKSRGLKNNKPLLFAVIQGGANLALREYCARELVKIGFQGYGFGARHIDSEGNFLDKALKFTAEQIPKANPRFGLGIGLPEDVIRAVKMGWDMFDCVIPTREGRHGRLFLRKTEISLADKKLPVKNFYGAINVTNVKFANDFSPINPLSAINDLRRHTKAYLNYLFKIKEPLAQRLASLNNLEFYLMILKETRLLIGKNEL